MLKPKPWERRKGESESAYAAFLAYRDMGGRRSLERLSEGDGDPNTSVQRSWGEIPSFSALTKLSSRWEWVERCRAWDNHLQGFRDREAAKAATKWERRRQAELEDLFVAGQTLRAKASEMLRFPLSRRRVEDGGKTTIIEPVKWGMRDVILGHEMAAKLIAAACDAAAKDPADMTDAELEGLVDVLDEGL